jgi:hypothetical protein
MVDVATLEERLRKLSGARGPTGTLTATGGRVLCARDVCASLFTEISETQLARRLTFTNDRSETFGCVANAGRVLSICLPDAKPYDLQRNPSDVDADDLAAIAGHLRAFARNVLHLEVRSERMDHAAQTRHGGLSAQPLFDLLATVADLDGDQACPLVTFTEQCGGLVDALVVLEAGEFPIAYGEAALMEALKAQALAERVSEEPGVDANADMSDDIGCMIYSGHPKHGRSVFCAMQSGALVLASFQYNDLGAIIALWQECLRS